MHDAARGIIDVPVTDWSLNSMGAMQGGVVAMVADVAAETALRAATGEPLVVTDLQLTYLGFGRVGPVRSTVEVLGTGPGHGTARVELVDAGAENRQMTVVHTVATRRLGVNGFGGAGTGPRRRPLHAGHDARDRRPPPGRARRRRAPTCAARTAACAPARC